MKLNSFIYPNIDEQTRNFAGVAPIINLNGDWTQFVPPNEEQRQNGVESSACFVEAQQACIAILKEYIYGIKDENYSARFNALLSGGTETGGDPVKGALSIKKDGLIPQSMMDWEGVNSFDDFHSWNGVDKGQCIAEGKKEASLWDKQFRIVVEKDMPLKTKYELLKEELKRCPVPMSFYAWCERNGKYYKPQGVSDCHLITAIVLKVSDDNEITIRDTYYPYIKVLEANSDFDFAMGWTIKKLSTEQQLNNAQKGLIILLYERIKQLLSQLKANLGEVITGIYDPKN